MVRKRMHSKLLKDDDIFKLYKPLEEEKSVRDKDKRGMVLIDLITYDEDKKIIYLIELKKCSGYRGCMDGNLSESTNYL